MKRLKEKYVNIVSKELRSIIIKIDVVVAAINRSNFQNYIKERLFDEIVNIEGMNDVSHIKMYQTLIDNMSATWAFLTCLIDWCKLNLVVS